MASKRTSKKVISKILPKTAERIVATSLQHPELGARRLVPLLKKKRISVSASNVQSILRREGLQNREKRLAQVKKRAKKAQKPKSRPKKPVTQITGRVTNRIVEISLQNPDFGARRLLPLLKKEKIRISASKVYAVLKRQGLQSRAARLAKLKERTKAARKPKSPPKKAMPKITDEVAERICEISLKNLDLGAKSLAPLLKKQGISVSSSAVYRILKHYDLQTRAKRYAKAAEITSEPVIIPKTFPEKIPPEVEARIAEVSLQNPECGARRLISLLQKEDIYVSVSAIYRILKRHDLENRQKRLLKLEALQAQEIPPELEIEGPELAVGAPQTEPTPAADEAPEPVSEPAVAVPIPPVDKPAAPAEEPELIAEAPEAGPIPAVDEAPEPAPEPAVAEAAEPERPPVRKAPVKTIKKGGHWVFYPLYLLLFLLIGYLGLHAVQTIHYARVETGTLTGAAPAAAGKMKTADSATSVQPLAGYRQIWERNLFNTDRVKEPEPEEKIALASLAPAKKGLGLELVGTVVADDPRLSRAIISNRSIRKQEAYREGDSAGKAKIKKILRNNVVITTADGDELLTVEIKESSRIAPSRLSKRVGSQTSAAQPAARTRTPRARTSSIRLKREEIADSFTDIDGLMEQMKIVPYKSGDQEAGFRLGSITRDSVLRKMGLRSRDVIVGIDDETITSPDDAADFFKRLADGGEVTIKLKRRRRTRQIKLNIE
ncbi:MAG: type II secretion system protein N [Desulfobacterales bacterium]